MKDYILAIKNHAIQHFQYNPYNWIYFANQSSTSIISSFDNDAYINAHQIHFFNVDRISISIMRNLITEYIAEYKDYWHETNDFRLEYHKNLLNNLEGSRTFCILYTEII